MFHQISVTVLARISSTLFGVISVIILANTLGSVGVGVFALGRALPAILSIICEFGAHTAAPFLIRRKKIDGQAVLGNLLSIALIAAVFELIVWASLVDIMRARFFTTLAPFDVWLVLAAPLGTFASTFESTLRAHSKIALANGVRFAGELALLVGISLLLVFENGSIVVLALIASRFIAFVFGAVSVRAVLGSRLVPSWEMPVLKAALHYGWRSQLGNAANILNYRLDHLIIAILSGPALVGVYSIATKAAEIFKFLPGSVRYVIEPQLAGRGQAAARKVTNAWIGRLFAGNALVLVVAFLLGPPLLPLVFSDWSVSSVAPFQVLLIGLLLAGANGAVSAFNLAAGKPELNAYPVLVGLVFTVVLDLVLIPIWGVIGAAWASTLSYSASAAILVGMYWRSRNELTSEPPVSAS